MQVLLQEWNWAYTIDELLPKKHFLEMDECSDPMLGKDDDRQKKYQFKIKYIFSLR